MVFAGNSSYADFRNDVVQVGISIRDGVNQLIDRGLDEIFNAFIPEQYRPSSLVHFSSEQEKTAYVAFQARKQIYSFNIKILAYNIATATVIAQVAFIIFASQLSLIVPCLLLIGARKILKQSIEDSWEGKVSEIFKNLTKWFAIEETNLGGQDSAGFFKTHTPIGVLVKLQELVNKCKQINSF